MPPPHLVDASATHDRHPHVDGLPGAAYLRPLLAPWLVQHARSHSPAHDAARYQLQRLSARLVLCATLSLASATWSWLLWQRHAGAPYAERLWAPLALHGLIAAWGAFPIHQQAFLAARHAHGDPRQLGSLAIVLSLFLPALPWISNEPLNRADFLLTPLLSTLTMFIAVFERLLRRLVRSGAHHLLGLLPHHVCVERSGIEQEVDIHSVAENDLVRVRPRDVVPVDGVLVSGRSIVHETRVTGEAMPEDKRPGSSLLGGTVNGRGNLLLRALRPARESVVAAMARYVRRAEHTRAVREHDTAQLARTLSVAVLCAAVLQGFVTYYEAERLGPALRATITLLVVAAPGALALACSLVFRLGLLGAARLGVLVNSAQTFETLAAIDTLVIGKASALTEGRPRVVSVVVGEGASEHEVLAMAAGVVAASDQPIARAITTRARTMNVTLAPIVDVHGLGGVGSLGRLHTTRVAVGNRRMLELLGVQDVTLASKADALCDHGQMVVFVVWGGQVRGLIGLVDPIKFTAYDALRDLHEDGVSIVLCTADAPRTAQHLAEELGDIEVIADVPRTEKRAVVRKLIEAGRYVAFATRSPHERAAQNAAHLAIDLHLEGELERVAPPRAALADDDKAQVTLVRGDLAALARARALARAVVTYARRGTRIALGYHAVVFVLASGVCDYGWSLTRTPWLSCGLQCGGILLVIGHALLLAKSEPYDRERFH